jgi:molecular chaperone DnaJ
MSEKRDYYEVLGVERGAASDDIRKAYKREALKHHPDRNPGDASAEAKFKAVNEAYQVLSDDEKRRVYDQFGHAGLEGGGGFEGVGDVFAHMQDLFAEMFSGGGFGGFGGRRQARRGGDLQVQARLSLHEAAFGIKREVTVHAPARCDDCGGSGAKAGTKPETCAHCRGSGHVSNARGFVMFTTPCPKCGGQGAVIKQHCKTCEGRGAVPRSRKVVVGFPAGIDSGQKLRVPGQGMPGPPGAPPGDLYVEIEVEEDTRFERDGADLVTRVHVSFADAALGAKLQIPSLGEPSGEHAKDATVQLEIPAGTQPGTVFTIKGQGIPRLDGRGRGSLVALIQVDVPKQLSDRAKKLLAELEAELGQASSGKARATGTK